MGTHHVPQVPWEGYKAVATALLFVSSTWKSFGVDYTNPYALPTNSYLENSTVLWDGTAYFGMIGNILLPN